MGLGQLFNMGRRLLSQYDRNRNHDRRPRGDYDDDHRGRSYDEDDYRRARNGRHAGGGLMGQLRRVLGKKYRD